MEFFTVIATIGVLIFIVALAIQKIGKIFLDIDMDKINFSMPVFIISGAVTFLIILGGWALCMMADFGTYGDCIKHIYWWKKVCVACLCIPTIICLLPNFYILFDYAMDNSKILLPYSIMALGASCVLYFLANIALNNYIGESFGVFLISFVMFIIILLCFIPYDANRARKLDQKLLQKIDNINKQINRVISKIGELRVKNITVRKYNKARRNINKVLSKKNMYQTFQPVFHEDESVLKMIKLIDSVSDSKLHHGYNKHKMLFFEENRLELLKKAKKGDSLHFYDIYLKSFSELLKGTVENNNSEIKSINSSAENTALFKKYNIAYKENAIRKKLILCGIFVFVLASCLATGNILLKLNQERIVAENYGKEIEGYEKVVKTQIWDRDGEKLFAEINNGELKYYIHDDYYRGIFDDSQEDYQGDKLSKWNKLKMIESVEEGHREKWVYSYVRGLIGLRKDGRVLISNEEKKWFHISRYDLYVGLYHNESSGKYFGLKADGELVQINKK